MEYVTLRIFLSRGKYSEESDKMLQQEPRTGNRICTEWSQDKMLVLKRTHEISEDSKGHKKHV